MKIKELFEKIKAKINAFLDKLFPSTKTAIDWAIEITSKLNSVLKEPIIDVVTFLIPGDLDDKLVAILKSKLPKILIGLNLVDKAIDSKDINEIVLIAMAELQNKDGLIKDALLHTLAASIATALADGELTWSEVVSVIEEAYQLSKK